MQIPVKQVWVYEFKPTDTMRLLHAIRNAWETTGDSIELVRKGGKIYAVRTNENH